MSTSSATSIDVLFCHVPLAGAAGEFRDHVARACLSIWRLDPLASVRIVQPSGSRPLDSEAGFIDGGPKERFHVNRWRLQEENRSEWWVLADDDCLPLGRHFVQRGLDAVRQHPEFGVVAANDIIANQWKALDADSGAIRTVAGVGGICFVSPACAPFRFDVDHPTHADGARHYELLAAGLKEGVLLDVRFNHLGFGFSSTVDGHCFVP